MKNKLIIFIAMGWHFTIFGQQVVSTSGSFDKASNGSISWSLGEVATETLGSGQTKITQGVQQPNLIITTIFELENSGINLIVYPNPASEFVKIKLDNEPPENLHYILFDINGKLLEKKNITTSETEISFTKLYPSTYFIKVFSLEKEVKTFKIQKILNQ
jgi:hypothetical protein